MTTPFTPEEPTPPPPDEEPTPEPEPEPEPPQAAQPVMAFTPKDLIDLVSASVKSAVAGVTEAQADPLANAMKRALKPENPFSPQVSVFNPRGERDFPRPALKCPMTLFDGIPIDGTTETVEEIELYNQLVAGEYRVSKSDNTLIPFRVREIRNDLGTLQRIDISFPYRDESDRQGLMPMVTWLRDVVRQIAENHERTLTTA